MSKKIIAGNGIMKILITGSSGFLGLKLVLYFHSKSKNNLYGCSKTRNVKLPGFKNFIGDLTSLTTVERIFKATKPEVVIHTAALANVDQCEKDPQLAYESNVVSTENIVITSEKFDSKLIYISTDMVYKDNKTPHKEESKLDPINVYSKTKLEGEKIILDSTKLNIILRTNFFGWSFNVKPKLAEWIVQNLREGKQLFLFNDVFFSPIYIVNLCEIIHRLMNFEIEGIFNCGGMDIVTKYSFGRMIANLFPALSIKNIQSRSIDELDLAASRPKNMGMDSTKIIKNLKDVYYNPTLKEEILQFKACETYWKNLKQYLN